MTTVVLASHKITGSVYTACMMTFVSLRAVALFTAGVIAAIMVGWRVHVLIGILVFFVAAYVSVKLAISDAIKQVKTVVAVATDPKQIAQKNGAQVISKLPFWLRPFAKKAVDRFVQGQ